MGSPTQLAKLAFGTADPVDRAVNFIDFDPGVTVEFEDTHGTTGDYDKDDIRIVPSRKRVQPTFSSKPTAIELAYLLAWGMWGTPTGSGTVTYPLGNTPAQRNIHYYTPNSLEWFLSGCAVNRLELRAVSGQALMVNAAIVGIDSDDSRSNYPAIALDKTTQAFIMSGLTLTVAGVSKKCREFVFAVEHNIDLDRYLNSFTLTEHLKQDQRVSLTLDLPASEAPALWRQAQTAGFSAVGTFVNALGGTLTMTMGSFRPAPKTPLWPSRQEGYVRAEGELTRTGTNRPVTITLVTGP